jgi:hypothetical protein
VLAERRRTIGAGVSCEVEHTAGPLWPGRDDGAGAPAAQLELAPGWRNAVEHAGIGHVRIHDLRHSYASWLLQAGVRWRRSAGCWATSPRRPPRSTLTSLRLPPRPCSQPQSAGTCPTTAPRDGVWEGV